MHEYINLFYAKGHELSNLNKLPKLILIKLMRFYLQMYNLINSQF